MNIGCVQLSSFFVIILYSNVTQGGCFLWIYSHLSKFISSLAIIFLAREYSILTKNIRCIETISRAGAKKLFSKSVKLRFATVGRGFKVSLSQGCGISTFRY